MSLRRRGDGPTRGQPSFARIAASSAIAAGPNPAQSADTEQPGLVLRRAREERGLTLDQLSRSTKIRRATLDALESSDVVRLPATIYTRGFIKAYAREVGLDPGTTADEYLGRIEPQTTQHVLVDTGMLPPISAATATKGRWNPHDDRLLLAANHARRLGRATTFAAVVGLIVYVISFNRQAADPGSSASGPAQPIPRDAVRAANIDRTDSLAHGAADAVSVTISGPLTVELAPQGPCWLVATVDGQRVVFRLMQPGERQTLEIAEEAVLRVGDPGALSISINGQTGRVLGPPGQPINVKITKANFKNFLTS